VKFHFQQAVRAFILLAFSILLFKLHFSGDITKYINPKYNGLSQSASIIFLILFFIQVTRIWTVKNSNEHHCGAHDHSCSHDHGDSTFIHKKLLAYTIIIFPLATGFLLPAKVLDASIVDKKGGMTILSNQKPIEVEGTHEQGELSIGHTEVIEPEEEITEKEYKELKQNLAQNPSITMNDNVYSTYHDEIMRAPAKYIGREIELKGFIYKEDELKADQFVIARFLITHCVADASIIGFLSEFPEATTLQQNTWIEAKGVLDISTFNGIEFPVIKIKKLKELREPEEPYLYPLTIRNL
jgi:putative membrane protein